MSQRTTSPPRAGRHFLGLALTESLRRALRAHLNPVDLSGRKVSSKDWHVTLRYLGEPQPEPLETLRGALGPEGLGPQFNIAFSRLGAFPDPERAGILWLGIGDGTAALTALAARVESASRRAGFPAEHRPYAPHVTLSRLRPQADVRPLVERVPAFSERMAVEAVVLFRTGHGRGLGHYEEVERFPLAAPP
ncbi:MAG TPA: RNA 2',3'-cyclic phosphodiesterase [Rubricoccaceae bacterium]|jgi:2'-5' RNA ligase